MTQAGSCPSLNGSSYMTLSLYVATDMPDDLYVVVYHFLRLQTVQGSCSCFTPHCPSQRLLEN